MKTWGNIFVGLGAIAVFVGVVGLLMAIGSGGSTSIFWMTSVLGAGVLALMSGAAFKCLGQMEFYLKSQFEQQTQILEKLSWICENIRAAMLEDGVSTVESATQPNVDIENL